MSSSKDNKGFLARHKVITVLFGIVILIIILVIATGGNKPTVNTTPTANTTSSSSGSKSTTKPPATTAHVGSTLAIGGSKGLAVTLSQVIDPANGADQFTTPDAGKRFIAVNLTIVNKGTAAYSDDANNNVTLIGSDNQSYTSDFDSVSECTNFNDGSYTLAAGESTTGCVVFEVPDAVTTSKVQFQTISGFSNSTGEWLVP